MPTSSSGLKNTKTLVIASALLILLAGGFFRLTCQSPRDGEERRPVNTPTPTPRPMLDPGQTGTRPPAATPVYRRITDTTGKVEPTQTPCDNTRQAQVELSKFGVTCATYNFTDLNNEAQRLVDAQLNKVQCPPGGPCAIRHSFYSYWTATCSGTTALVKIKGYAVCATNNSNPDSADPGIPPPTDRTKPSNRVTPAPVTMKAGENNVFQPIDNGDYVKGEAVTFSAGTTLACPSNSLYVFTYKEKDPQIPALGVGDYAPYIGRAINQATYLHTQYQCATGCNKLPFSPLYIRWSKDGEYVVIEVYFMVTCQ